jgi:methylated-DNA-protein-cysteine methyltransferase-like protein
VKTEKENLFDLVYQVVKLIPEGKVTTYGSIASFIGLKSGARMVGYAMNAAHNIPDLPAHRVVNRMGMLTGKHHFETSDHMQQLLEEEGHEIKDDKIVDFKKKFWDPSLTLAL